MKKLSVGSKLVGGFVLVLVLAGAIGWGGLGLAARNNREMRGVFREEVSGLVELSRVVAAANETRRRGLVNILTTDPQEKIRLGSEMDKFSAEVERRLDALGTLWAGRPERLELLARLRTRWSDYSSERRKAHALSASGNFEEARAQVVGPASETFVAAQEVLDELVGVSEKRAAERLAEADASFVSGRYVVIGLMALAIAVGLTVGIALSRGIARNVAALVRAAEGIAAGDLGRRAEVKTADEIGALAATFNTMAARLEDMVEGQRRASDFLQRALLACSEFAAKVAAGDLTVRLSANGSQELDALSGYLNRMVEGLGALSSQVREGADGIGAAADEILSAVNQHSATAAQQSAAINETTTTVEQIRAAAEQVAEKAREVARRAQTSVEVSNEGARTVGSVVGAMGDIRGGVEAIAQDILELSERSQQIGEITATVDDLADQSNLLALNAAIEAAKAGEQGKGFAVVADEVRNLAEQSKHAAAQVRTILKDIQKATDTAVMATEQGTGVAEKGLEVAARAGEAIEQLAETIREGYQASQLITAGAHQQRVGMDQIAQAMTEISQAMTQFVAGAEQSKDAAEGLNDLAGRLQELTNAYKV